MAVTCRDECRLLQHRSVKPTFTSSVIGCAQKTDIKSCREGKLTTCWNKQIVSKADWICAYLPGMACRLPSANSVSSAVPASAMPGTNVQPPNEGVAAAAGSSEATTSSG